MHENRRETSGNQPSSISLEAIARGAPHPSLHHPTHKMSSTHSHSFVNIQKYCFPFTETTIFYFKETTAWGANFLARSDRKVSAGKAIHFLNNIEYRKCRNLKARTISGNRNRTYISSEPWNELSYLLIELLEIWILMHRHIWLWRLLVSLK